ncbi:O-antigen ligase [uncultured Lamprocystis sp.]|jgi:O-antigen ligase|uniref:O-antigen ligase family protein n=1 Tax=uncultured Lamprocystis sp. TaxID=543132 RepID=UPI0025CB8A73|nr:O-antigen ligase family protein [uncultured Lamprocystis sp.]
MSLLIGEVRMIASRPVGLLWWALVGLVVLASALPLLTAYPLLALIPGLGVVFLLVIGRRPEFGLYAIVFLIPFGNFRDLGGPLENIRIHWLLALVLLLIVAARLLSDSTFVARFRSNLWPWFLLFLAASLLSTFFSDYQGSAAAEVVLTLVAIVFFGLTIALTDQIGVTRHLPIVIATSVSLGSLLAVIGSVFHIGLFSEGDTFSRSTGGTADPNALAMQIIFGLPFVVFFMTHTRRHLVRLLALVMLFINVGAMVGTFSRSGALVVTLVLLTLFFINARKIRPRQLGLLFAGAVAVLLLASLMLPQSFWQRQETLVSSGTDRSLNRRGSYLIVARDALIARPLLGYGPGTFRDLYEVSDWAQRYDRKGSTNRRFAHNTYIEVLVGTGLLGFFFFAGLLITAMRNLLRTRRLFLVQGDGYHADEVLHHLVAFGFLLLYMAMFSDVFQKFMLLSIGLSAVWLRTALAAAAETTVDSYGAAVSPR